MADTAYKNCTIDPLSNCGGCGISGQLECKWNKGALVAFWGVALPPTLISLATIAFTSYLTSVWWLLIGYLIYFVLMFNVFEIRFLCSHCPYYAEPGKTLRCLANHGSPKLWRYRPGPMNRLEKGLMVFLIATIFFVAPLAVAGYGLIDLLVLHPRETQVATFALAALCGAILLSSGSFVVTLRRYFCSKCVNFSCPLNTVEKSIVDAYLRKNDVMREAWMDAGYRLEEGIKK